MKKIILVMAIGMALILSGCFDDEDSSSATSYKQSSGEMCTWTKAIYNDGREKIMGTGCPSGEVCTKSSKDLDGDGSLCYNLETSDGTMQVCDGVCS